jgi:hypothetical protein
MRVFALAVLVLAVGLFASKVFGTGGDAVWLAFVLFMATAGGILEWPRAVTIPCLLVGMSVFVAHVCGYKVYGEMPLYDNRPLIENALELEKIESPNLLVAKDGSKHALRGVKFRPEVLAMRGNSALRFLAHRDTTFRFRYDPSSPSAYVMEHPIFYFCGNVFFARLFPGRAPTYRTSDAAEALRMLVNPE